MEIQIHLNIKGTLFDFEIVQVKTIEICGLQTIWWQKLSFHIKMLFFLIINYKIRQISSIDRRVKLYIKQVLP
jgi:hypothetical protein